MKSIKNQVAANNHIVFVFLLLAGICQNVLAQNISINSTAAAPAASAMLDIASTSKGLLIPRVALTATNAAGPVTSPATSLLVYNTATAGSAPYNVLPGFYYWNGTMWVAFTAPLAGTGWSASGNAGLTAANFVGTSEDKVMTIKSNANPFMEFGKRGTLGLTQASKTDYTDATEQVTYVRSALQFQSGVANLYKTKIWTDTYGNFRVKGNAGTTDNFQFGAVGTNEDGGFDIIVGDDGDEAIVFKSYNYITGMSELMRLQNGSMAVGSTSFDATNREKILVDAGTTTSYNLMTGKGSINNYLQINVKNNSDGDIASSDFVATANNGNETTNYVDMGINGSGNTSDIMGGANAAYLYNAGQNFLIGTSTAAKSLSFLTGGTSQSTNERMTIDGNGNVGIGTSTFNGSYPEQFVVDAGTTTSVNAIVGKGTIDNYLQLNIQNKSTGGSASSDVVATADNGSETTNFIDMGINSSNNSSGVMGGNDDAYVYNIGQNLLIGTGTPAMSLVFMTGGTLQGTNERMRIDGSGNVGILTAAPNSTLEVSGSVGLSILTISSGTTALSASHHTVIITGGAATAVSFPAAASNTRKIFTIMNQMAASKSTGNYINFSGGTSNTVAANSSITVQSDGSNWYRIQ